MKRRTRVKAKTPKHSLNEEMQIMPKDATNEDRAKKTWTRHDIKAIKPLNEAQKSLFRAYYAGQQIVAAGSAGTGKSYISLYLALNDIFDPSRPQDKLIIVRSTVPSREIGFLPGSLEEKIAVYEQPYQDMINSMFSRSKTYLHMKEAGKIEFMSTSFVRGLTWDNAVIILDEAQNCTFHEISSIMTRLGDNSRIVFCGDTKQGDLTRGEKQGFSKLIAVAGKMDEFHVETFLPSDIVRSKLVKAWLMAVEDTE